MCQTGMWRTHGLEPNERHIRALRPRKLNEMSVAQQHKQQQQHQDAYEKHKFAFKTESAFARAENMASRSLVRAREQWDANKTESAFRPYERCRPLEQLQTS